MPAIIRVENRRQLAYLAEAIEAQGGDATRLKELGEQEFGELSRQTGRVKPIELVLEQAEDKRLSRLKRLFPQGIPFAKLIEYDRNYSLEELKKMCSEKGLSISGDKKELAAKLIAREETN